MICQIGNAERQDEITPSWSDINDILNGVFVLKITGRDQAAQHVFGQVAVWVDDGATTSGQVVLDEAVLQEFALASSG